MQLIIEERDKQAIHDIALKQQEINALLEQEADRQTCRWLKTLAESLLTYSHCHALLKLSAVELLDWLRHFLAFLDQRQTLASIEPFRPNPDETYVLINAPDVPYVVDSLQNLFVTKGLRATIISHPILTVKREHGRLMELDSLVVEGDRESFLLVEAEQDLVDMETLSEAIRQTLATAQEVGQQQQALSKHLADIGALAEVSRHTDFVDWLQKGNFICFGHTQMDVQLQTRSRFTMTLTERPLGLLLEGMTNGVGPEQDSRQLQREFRQLLLRKEPLVVEVLDQISPLHRNEPLVYIGFRQDLGKKHWREHAFVGLFSQLSINELTVDVPPLRDKILAALQRRNIPQNSYDYRKVVDIFNTFPKVEIFFLSEQELDSLVHSFVSLQRQNTVKLVMTRSLSLRAVILLVIMPADYYSPETIRRMETYLGRYLQADRIDSRIIHSYSQYLSLHIRILPKVNKVRVDIDRLERMLTEQARPWDERLRLLMRKALGRHRGHQHWATYTQGFNAEYKAFTHPRFAVRDIRSIERLRKSGAEVFDLWGPFKGDGEYYRLQYYSLLRSDLNELMPLLENLNLAVIDEVDFSVTLDDATVYIKSFSVRNADPAALPLSTLRRTLLQTLRAMRRGDAENDYLNRLQVLTGLDWKAIDVFRAYRNYYFQLGNPFTKRRVAFALINNPRAALLLYQYFDTRFCPNPDWQDPLVREEEALMPVRMELAEALNAVQDINEDRILRSLFNLIDSTIRTNYFLRRDTDHYFLSFKVSAIGIIEMPFPRPLYETYVHSSTMEGIHLRGGKVARGGIRWSDRPDDFRTEILGLMKAQMTKNSLIVPVGSKGGFVVKTAYATREEGAELSRQAYITLMQGLLDLTDNRVGGEVRTPPGVVAYDDKDPYLVVAADKGTAHLPDTANQVSADYGFWLSDAFASGGTHGYDHKKFGVTARGAWESVKRHFRELGKDIQNEPFTVIGIGDMSGDVFGNGMLLSKQIRLLAAFDHRHVFIDPDPDPGKSWLERQRLFTLPRSSWEDYDRSLISRGGGIWPRNAKDIPLSDEMKEWLGVRYNSIDADGLIRRILTSETELLWNGGIGTYVKASTENHTDAGDRANDAVRVDASQLRVKVVGEGGNLGLTQRGRIEFALLGGMINTDSVDNSGGVDTSDHEVNLKILMQQMLEDKTLKSAAARNKLLMQLQEDVCLRVWDNNYSQSLCLSLDLLRSERDPEPYLDLIDRLVNSGLLDRRGEFLPSRKELVAREGGFTRPELAILMSYAKMHLYQALLEGDLPDQEASKAFLYQYFPATLRAKYADNLDRHPLRREIIATTVTNAVVDQAGSPFLNLLSRQSGAGPVEVAKAYLLFDQVLGAREIRKQVFALDNRLPTGEQYRVLIDLEDVMLSVCALSLELNLSTNLTADCVKSYSEKLSRYRDNLPEILSAEEWGEGQGRAEALQASGFDKEIALQISTLRYLVAFLPIVSIAEDSGSEVLLVSQTMNNLRNQLSLTVINGLLDLLPINDRWDRLAQIGLRKAIMGQVFALSRKIVSEADGQVGPYLQQRRQRYQYYRSLVEAMQGHPPASCSPFTVLMRALEGLQS